MPAKGKVSIIWQCIFTIIPILDLIAFYRIKKLQKYLLFVYVPIIVISIILAAAIASTLGDLTDPLPAEDNPMWNIGGLGMQIGFTAFAIFLQYTWCKRWNDGQLYEAKV